MCLAKYNKPKKGQACEATEKWDSWRILNCFYQWFVKFVQPNNENSIFVTFKNVRWYDNLVFHWNIIKKLILPIVYYLFSDVQRRALQAGWYYSKQRGQSTGGWIVWCDWQFHNVKKVFILGVLIKKHIGGIYSV